MRKKTSFQGKKDARAWVRQMVKELGLGFHPDTSAQDYVRVDGGCGGGPFFAPTEVLAFERRREAAVALLGDEIYEVSLCSARRILARQLHAGHGCYHC